MRKLGLALALALLVSALSFGAARGRIVAPSDPSNVGTQMIVQMSL
jgi:hypothetical protein